MNINDAPAWTSDGRVKVAFTLQVEMDLPPYSDTLYLSPAEWESMSVEDLSAMELDRYNNWVAIVRPGPPTYEQMIQQIADIDSQLISLAADRENVIAQIAAADAEAWYPSFPTLIG